VEEPGEGGDEVGGLLDGVDDVVAPEDEAENGLPDEGDVERHLGEGGPGLHSSHRQGQAAQMTHALDRSRLAPREGEEVDPMPQLAQSPHEMEHGQGRASHLEERLRGEEQDPQ
jgi:hypothetical protein